MMLQPVIFKWIMGNQHQPNMIMEILEPDSRLTCSIHVYILLATSFDTDRPRITVEIELVWRVPSGTYT